MFLNKVLFPFASLLLTLSSLSAQARHNSSEVRLEKPSLTTEAPFISHKGSGRFSSYLAMNLVYDDFTPLLRSVENNFEVALQSRGEAHVTVITPLEYYDVLQDKVSLEEIDNIANNFGIQSSELELLCVGRGQKEIGGKIESTYFVVAQSQNLLNIRKEIQKLYEERGGEPSAFKADNYFPHVTLGFTLRDLHESDGILKDQRSCVAQFKP